MWIIFKYQKSGCCLVFAWLVFCQFQLGIGYENVAYQKHVLNLQIYWNGLKLWISNVEIYIDK